jgi:hypothetical protein
MAAKQKALQAYHDQEAIDRAYEEALPGILARNKHRVACDATAKVRDILGKHVDISPEDWEVNEGTYEMNNSAPIPVWGAVAVIDEITITYSDRTGEAFVVLPDPPDPWPVKLTKISFGHALSQLK